MVGQSRVLIEPPTPHNPRSPLPLSVVLKSLLRLAVTSRGSRFRNSINQRDGGKCVVTGNLHYEEGLHSGEEAGILEAAHILRRSIIQTQSGGSRIAGTIGIIKHYTKLPVGIMDDLAAIIDDPMNGMLLDLVMHRLFDNYSWCLRPTDVVHKYKVHWFGHVPQVRKILQRSNSRTTLELAFRFPTLRSLRSMLRLPISYTSVVLVKSQTKPTIRSLMKILRYHLEIRAARKISVSDYR
ncbi:hypothetical protein BDR04DRAFT_1086689 [Suillus decipiens]|nr:hypothetical protein BDR04DRAFT_1086689 [Suillus decipiens]